MQNSAYITERPHQYFALRALTTDRGRTRFVERENLLSVAQVSSLPNLSLVGRIIFRGKPCYS